MPVITIFGGVFCVCIAVHAANNSQSTESADSQSVSETAELPEYLDTDPENVGDSPTASILQQVIGVDASQPLEIIILLTIIALLPSLLIMMTCFTRIVIVLSFLRTAMQTQNTPIDYQKRYEYHKAHLKSALKLAYHKRWHNHRQRHVVIDILLGIFVLADGWNLLIGAVVSSYNW